MFIKNTLSRKKLSKPKRRSTQVVISGEYQSIWRMFGLVFALSLLLTIFLLYRQRQWRGAQQRTILLVEQPSSQTIRSALTLLVIKPDNKVVILPIPPEQRIEAPFQYGVYNSDALAGLTQLENLDWEFLEYSIALEYGVAIDGLIWIQPSADQAADESSSKSSGESPEGSLRQLKNIGQLRQLALLTWLNLRPSNLAFWDRLAAWIWLMKVPSYQLENVDLKAYLNEDQQLDQVRYDKWAQLYLQDTQIRASNFAVAVKNASQIDGYATRVGRMLALMGYFVRGIETIADEEKSQLLFDPGQMGWPSERLQAVFPMWQSKKVKSLREEERVPAVVILGPDQADLFKK